MKRRSFLILIPLLALCLLLTGCSTKSAAPGTVIEAAAPEQTPTPVHFTDGDVAPNAEQLSMRLRSGETALLDSLTALKSVDLSGSENEEEIAAWVKAHPGIAARYTVTLPNGTVLDSSTQSVDLSSMTAAECEQSARKLALLPALNHVTLGSEGRNLGWNDIARLRELLPTPVFDYAFKLYGTDCNLSNTTISLYKVSVTDKGALIDEVMRYMPQLTYVDMDSCGVDPKRLEEINLNHPNVKVVFRVYFGDNYTARTDTERILASMASKGGMLNNDNVSGLYYCHDVKYLDLGHNTLLSNIGFVAQMPKLEVAILSMCNIRDASPLASCSQLEYLEMSNTYCDDMRPFSGLTNLRHLNVAGIGYDFYGDGTRPSLKDITPLYSLTGLERLWIGGYNPVPRAQIEEMQRRAPQCEIDTSVYEDPVGGRWRYLALADYENTYVDTLHPRYIKLREQFGDYDQSVFNFTWNDPLYDEHYRYVAATPTPTPTPAAAVVTATPVPAATPAPTYVQPQPSYQEPVYYPPQEYTEEPYYEEPAAEEPTPYVPEGPAGDLVFNIPGMSFQQDPVAPEPQAEQPAVQEQPAAQEPQAEQPAFQEQPPTDSIEGDIMVM